MLIILKKKIEAKELKCNSAKFVSEINPYLIDYGYSGLVTSCVLQNSFQGNKNDCIDKTSEEDTETSKIISEIFYRNEKAQLLNESSAVQTIKPHELDAESHTNSNNIGEGASTMTNVKNVYVKNDNLKNDNVKNVNVIAKSSLDDGEMIDLTNTLNWDDNEPQDLGKHMN
uniref:Uncharacterized protein n=1 Tax=Meloidogyne hapla TaxID=6305 RepID=A0A1I8B8C2_MELHA